MAFPDNGNTGQGKWGDGSNSSVGSQIRKDYYKKMALVEVAKEMYFSQMADTMAMPKNMGKTIKQYLYLPLLDDANINDQGLDAAGASTAKRQITYIYTPPFIVPASGVSPEDVVTNLAANGMNSIFITGYGANDAAAIADAKAKLQGSIKTLTAGKTSPGVDYNATVLAMSNAGWDITDGTYNSALHTQFNNAAGVVTVGKPQMGNLYGSSKDVGTISSKLPALSETGGRVNRVGYRRVTLEGTLNKFGFFDEYTQESLDFDTDDQLEQHINRVMLEGANEIYEDKLQIDLLNAAGVVRFGGDATSRATVKGEGAVAELTYDGLMRLALDLDDTNTPKNTTIIAGSRMIDTKTIDAARYAYIGNELLITLKSLEDNFQNQAFVPVHRYASAGNVARGEVGAIDQFRFIVVPEMMHWEGVGQTVSSNTGNFRTGVAPGSTTEKYNVYPVLVVGSGSFTTVGFQTDGKGTKFTITHQKPTADRLDPYGETGFMSIKWYYGFMVLRPERIGLYHCVAKY